MVPLCIWGAVDLDDEKVIAVWVSFGRSGLAELECEEIVTWLRKILRIKGLYIPTHRFIIRRGLNERSGCNQMYASSQIKLFRNMDVFDYPPKMVKQEFLV